ncbi:hypothetical protein DENSPDRAFT_786422 [Dentipellis sp. KUC8613]|nr:hypothetical protein DENSPDRAFT_786422 [Dentipellis sp. KUC8613]
MKYYALLSAVMMIITLVSSQAQPWAQCGGIGWSGPTTCVTGWECVWENAYHSQCVPPVSSTVVTTLPPTPSASANPLKEEK